MGFDRVGIPNAIKKGVDQADVRPAFTPLGMWAFSVGTSIGWGSFIVTCNTYLKQSGILGTVYGLLIGMAVILVITWNLQYMIRSSPNAGGLYTFEKHIGGKDMGFLAFWFVLLTYMAILWANITSVPLFARFFLGDIFRFGFHYHIFGYEVWFGEALLSICSIVVICLLCSRSSRIPNVIMVIAAFAFSIGFTVCALFAMLRHEGAFSYEPMYTENAGDFAQIIRIATISPWAFIGFENISHFAEEYTFPVKKVRGILLSSVLVTTFMYIAVCMLSVSAYPPEYDSWLSYIRDMRNLEGIKAVPAFYAADHYLGRMGIAVLMFALFGVILTSLIGNMLALSRLIFAAGREGEASPIFSKLSERGIPRNSIYVITLISVFIPFLGRTAIGWIVDVTTLGATMIYGFISHSVYLHAKERGRKLEQYTGIAGIGLMIFFMVMLLVPGLLSFEAMATESYALFIVWSLLGLAYFRYLILHDKSRGYRDRRVVWIILLVMVLFASMMWVSRATQNAANDAVERIFQYHQEHAFSVTNEGVEDARVAFLHEQANQISRTNMLHTMVSLGLFMLSTIIMLNNYKETRMLGEQLDEAEEVVKAAKEIAELKESISALMDNMPAMCASKDAMTGTYIACNQAFAEFANKKTPTDVVGLTDHELFGPDTAAYFMGEAEKVKVMDEPYIVNEDISDALGNQRQLQTTMLRYYDANGRLCFLKMSMDITEMESAKRANEQTFAAYQEALNTTAIYENMVHALSEDYFDLYYVDLLTDEYIEYGSRTERGHKMRQERGVDFFENSKKNAFNLIYKADLGGFLNVLNKNSLLEAIKKHGAFVYYYRLMINGVPTYVSMKATRISGDNRHIIIGINNVDTQLKDRKAAERSREDRKTYMRLKTLNNNLIVMYIVDLEDDNYMEFSAIKSYEGLGIAKQGNDFFATTIKNGLRVVYPDDLNLFCSKVNKENILKVIDQNGVFILDYRLVMESRPIYVSFKAAKIEEEGRTKLIVGLLDIDAQVRHEKEYANNLSAAQTMAIKDELTGVKNKHAYVDVETKLNEQIETDESLQFAVVICDINDLKTVNDTLGHRAGDAYIRKACSIICNVFKHSPVFRIGGDEFVVICQGFDYQRIDELLESMNSINAANKLKGEVQIACGMSKFDRDRSVETVFERADHMMYEHKARLKNSRPA